MFDTCFLLLNGVLEVLLKVKFALEQATNAQSGSTDIALLFLYVPVLVQVHGL
jgi:hypothetical protein